MNTMYLPWVIWVPVAASFHNERVTVDIVCLALLMNILIFNLFLDLIHRLWISFHKNSPLSLYSREKAFIAG